MIWLFFITPRYHDQLRSVWSGQQSSQVIPTWWVACESLENNLMWSDGNYPLWQLHLSPHSGLLGGHHTELIFIKIVNNNNERSEYSKILQTSRCCPDYYIFLNYFPKDLSFNKDWWGDDHDDDHDDDHGDYDEHDDPLVNWSESLWRWGGWC